MNGGRKEPEEGDVLIVKRYDKGRPTEHEAVVDLILSRQFAYVTRSGLRDLMLFDSTDWRYPQDAAG